MLARQLRNNTTKAEVKLWMELRGDKMLGYDFHRQKPIDNYILDFFCYELMLGIETDGFTHQFEEVFEKDKAKEARMNELGITILRFTDNEVANDIINVTRVIEIYIQEYEAKHGRMIECKTPPCPPQGGKIQNLP